MLLGYDDDLANETTRLTNRARDLLMNISPTLERALGPRITHPAVQALITQFPTPQLLRAADPDHVSALLRANAPRIHTTIHTEVTQALVAQTVVIPGTTAAGRVLASIIGQLDATLTERTQLLTELENGLDAHPLGKVLTSMPGVGVRTALKLLTIIGDGAAFPTAGLRRTRTRHPTVRHIHPRRKPLTTRKPSPEISAVPLRFRSPERPCEQGRTTTRNEPKANGTTPPSSRLSRRRVDVLHPTLRTGQHYRPPTPTTARAA